MGLVIYNGARVIPSPFVSFTDEPILAGNQERVGTTYRIQIVGKIVEYAGSPAALAYGGGSASSSWGGYNNQFWLSTSAGDPPNETNIPSSYNQLSHILLKQEALRNLFSQEGLWLEFQSDDGSAPFKCQPKNIQVNFSEGLWFNVCDYTITAECDVIYLNGQILNANFTSDLIQNCAEQWEIQPADNVKTFSVTHTVSAVGKRIFDTSGNEIQTAWQNARNFVNDKLVLGWNGYSSGVSPITGSSIFQQSSLGSGVLNFSTFNPYNFSRTENVDELNGSYSCTENWILAQGSGTNIYTVNARYITDDAYTNINASIQGTIRGYYQDLFDYDLRLQAAEYEFSQIGGTSGLLNLITPYVTGYTFNVQPSQLTLDYNYNEGTITYAADFTNTLYEGDAFETFTLARKTSAESYLTTFDINGTIKGRRYPNDTDQKAPFKRAYLWWSTLSGNDYSALYSRILSSEYFPEASSMGIQQLPFNKSVDLDEANGLISYSLEFNNRSNDGFSAYSAIEEYQINKQYSRDDGITHYNINGTVKGLNTSDVNSRLTKFENASGYFYTNVEPNVYQRIVNYYNISLPDTTPMSVEIGTYPIAGEITYGYSYWDVLPPMLPGALSEHIVVSDNNYDLQVNTIANVAIPGRQLGAILQNINTTPARTRTLSIEAVVPVGSSGDNISNLLNPPDYDSYALQAKPANAYCTRFDRNWEYRFGRFSLNVEWIYS